VRDTFSNFIEQEYKPIIGVAEQHDNTKPNKLYIFQNEDSRNIEGIYLDFNIANKIFYPDDRCLLTSDEIDGKDGFRINVGSNIYAVIPDEIEYVSVKSINNQILNFVSKLI